MAWVKLDDRFWSNRKVRKAGSSISVYILALSWSADELTDGHIPCEELDFVCTGIDDPKHHAEKLTEIGLFDLDGDVYVIPDYLEFNESAETIRARREKDRLRKAKGGRASSKQPPDDPPAESRRNPTRPPDGSGPDSERIPAGVPTESGSPDPTRPDPTRPSTEEIVADGSAATDNTTEIEDEPHPDDVRICQHLADSIEIRTQKAPKQPPVWFNDARLLRERGPTDWATPATIDTDLIIRAIDWATADEFWRTNILSPGALRRSWTRMTQQANEQRRTGATPAAQQRANANGQAITQGQAMLAALLEDEQQQGATQ